MTRIVDGDTVEIQYNDKLTSVVLIGVDTPETVHPQKPVEVFGKEASAFTRNLLLGESVYLRFDSNRTDRYGRLLAYLYRAPDGLFVNLEIVRQGYGKVYTTFPFKHKELFQYYGGQAQKAGRGLWSASNLGSRQAQIEDAPRTQTVYITRTGAKYHRGSCRYLKYSKIPISLEKQNRTTAPALSVDLKRTKYEIQSICDIRILVFCVYDFAYSHSGRTNSAGCHNVTATGGYHCHGGGSSSGSGGGSYSKSSHYSQNDSGIYLLLGLL